jgi:hypothetical protein
MPGECSPQFEILQFAVFKFSRVLQKVTIEKPKKFPKLFRNIFIRPKSFWNLLPRQASHFWDKELGPGLLPRQEHQARE